MTEVQKYFNQAAEIAAPMTVAAAVGYLCAHVFLTINPVHAAVFSASAALVSRVISPIFEEAFNGWNKSDLSKLAGKILAIATSIAGSAAISTALGFPMTFNEGAALAGTVFGVTISTALAVDLMKDHDVIKI